MDKRASRLLAGLSAIIFIAGAGLQSASAQTVGSAEHVLNTVYGTPPNAGQSTLKIADTIAFQELLRTEANSAAGVKFVNGSALTIGQSAQVTVDQFVFNPATVNGHGLIAIAGGTLRFVTGAMPKGRITFDTPLATIGIRGTIIKIGVEADGSTVIALEEGAAVVNIKQSARSIPLSAGQSLRIDAKSGAQPVLNTVVPVGSAVVDLGWDQGVGQMHAAAGPAGPAGQRPTAVAMLKPATEGMIRQVESSLGTIPGGILVTGETNQPGNSLPKIAKLSYSPQSNTFRINGSIDYQPPLPPALVNLVWTKLSDKGLPGTSLTRDSAIVFGGFEPYDPIGTMLVGADDTAGSMMKFPQEIRDHYDMPPLLKRDFTLDTSKLVIMFNYHNKGFALKGNRLVGNGVELDPYFLPTAFVNGERVAQPERLGELNANEELQDRLKAFVDGFDSIKNDVAVDFVTRLSETIDFVRYARANNAPHDLAKIEGAQP